MYNQAMELESINRNVITPADTVSGKPQEDETGRGVGRKGIETRSVNFAERPYITGGIAKVDMLCCASDDNITLSGTKVTIGMMITGQDVVERSLLLDTVAADLSVGIEPG